MKEYLIDKGIIFGVSEWFKPEPVMTDNPRSLDAAPSRQGKATGEGNKKQAEVTTRDDQIKKV
jgi:hypothetical protein